MAGGDVKCIKKLIIEVAASFPEPHQCRACWRVASSLEPFNFGLVLIRHNLDDVSAGFDEIVMHLIFVVYVSSLA